MKTLIIGVACVVVASIGIAGFGVATYHNGYANGMHAGQADPTVPHAIRNGDVYQLLCPGDNWAISATTPLPRMSNDEYATSPMAFKCVPQSAHFLMREVGVPGTDKSYIEQYCPTDYGPVPFLGSGGGGGSDLMCGRKEWLQAHDEQDHRRSDIEFKDVPKK